MSSPLERLKSGFHHGPFTRLKSLLRVAETTTRRARRRPSHSAAQVERLEPRALLSAPTPAADTTAPTATAIAEDVTTVGGTSYTFSVQFSDDVAIDVSTIDEWDVSLSGPNATSPRPFLVSLDVEFDGTPRTATYRITPPGGAWTKSDNGTYLISLRNLVSDTSGNRVPAGFIGSFDVNVPDVETPSAALATAAITLGGLGSREIEVAYSDDGGIDRDSIDPADIVVSGPNGFSAVPVSALARWLGNADGSPRTAVYQITAPGGSWDPADNGTYTVWMKPNSVFDTSAGSNSDAGGGKAVPQGPIGTFEVNITPAATFQVNETTVGDQYAPSVARDAAGNYVVIWQSSGIVGQRFDADGSPLGSEFAVTDHSTSGRVALAMNPSGNFVAAYRRTGSELSGIYVQRFDLSGARAGEPVRLTDSNDHRNPAIAMDADGDFVVAWQDDSSYSHDSDIYAQVLNAAGELQGEVFRANTSTDNKQFAPVVAMDSGGNFAIAWTRDNPELYGDSTLVIQRYDSRGQAVGGELHVGTPYNDLLDLGTTDLAMNQAGASVLIWLDVTRGHVYAQRFDTAGRIAGAPIRVSSRATQERIEVAMDRAGDFVVTWNEQLPNGDECDVNDPHGVFAQWFTASGQTYSDPVLVAGTNVGDDPTTALSPAVAMTPEGALVVVWAQQDFDREKNICFEGTYYYYNAFPDDYDILARQFAPVFSPDRVYATGADSGGGPHVRVFDAASGVERLGFFAYDPAFTGGVRVAVGDIDGDGIPDVVTAAGPGGGPHVRAFSGLDGKELHSFFAYDQAFAGGVYVAAADLNSDNRAEIITGAGAGGGPHVRVFDGATGELLSEFFAYDPAFAGGVRVAAGDLDGDGTPEIITAAGPGGGPHVRAWNWRTGEELWGRMAYVESFSGGVYVAAADLTGDGRAEVITGAGPGGGPHVMVFDIAAGSAIDSFFAYDPDFTGGVRVSAGLVDGDTVPDIITAPGAGSASRVRAFSGVTGAEIRASVAYDPGFTGGAHITGTLQPPAAALQASGDLGQVARRVSEGPTSPTPSHSAPPRASLQKASASTTAAPGGTHAGHSEPQDFDPLLEGALVSGERRLLRQDELDDAFADDPFVL